MGSRAFLWEQELTPCICWLPTPGDSCPKCSLPRTSDSTRSCSQVVPIRSLALHLHPPTHPRKVGVTNIPRCTLPHGIHNSFHTLSVITHVPTLAWIFPDSLHCQLFMHLTAKHLYDHSPLPFPDPLVQNRAPLPVTSYCSNWQQ